jgi:uncharacterized protein YjiS (DUF1127 family)
MEMIMSHTAPQAAATHSAAENSVVMTGMSLLARLWRTWQERREHKRKIEHLAFLSDELLTDVGLTRGQVWPPIRGQEVRVKISRYY